MDSQQTLGGCWDRSVNTGCGAFGREPGPDPGPGWLLGKAPTLRGVSKSGPKSSVHVYALVFPVRTAQPRQGSLLTLPLSPWLLLLQGSCFDVAYVWKSLIILSVATFSCCLMTTPLPEACLITSASFLQAAFVISSGNFLSVPFPHVPIESCTNLGFCTYIFGCRGDSAPCKISHFQCAKRNSWSPAPITNWFDIKSFSSSPPFPILL